MEVRIEKDADGTYIAYSVGENDMVIIGRGDSVKEAKEDFYNSMEEMLEDMTVEEKSLITEPVFHFDISSLFEYYKVINVSAFAKLIGINACLLRQYKMGKTYVSDKQIEKIEDGIHELGKELCELKLT